MLKIENPVLEVENLSVVYGNGNKGIENISMDVACNQVTALIGPSGCGKSTFLRTLNRINDLFQCRYSGSVRFNNTELLTLGHFELCRLRGHDIGYVMQKPVPISGKTILNDIALPLTSVGIKDKDFIYERVKDVLKRVALWDEVSDRLKTQSAELSGGQQQRMCIARAIINAPKVLLLDEPCSALDPKSTFKIEELIRNLKEQHSIIIVTHNMQEAQRVAENTAFFYEGNIVEYGSTDQVFNAPHKPLTKEYIQGSFS